MLSKIEGLIKNGNQESLATLSTTAKKRKQTQTTNLKNEQHWIHQATM